MTNKELNTMIKMENLIGKFSKEIFGTDSEKEIEVQYIDEKVIITASDFIDYICLIGKLLNEKTERANKANAFNKRNKEYHKIINSISYYKKIGNKEKLKYWQDQLKKYKEEL